MTFTNDDTPLPRADVPTYIEQRHGKSAAVTEKTLAKLAVVGGGPEFCRYGRRVAYLPSAIDQWIASRRSAPMKSTSDNGGSNASA